MTTETFSYGFTPLNLGFPRHELSGVVTPVPVIENTVEIPTTPEWPTVRSATHADLASLVAIELAAYPDVYGTSHNPSQVNELTTKYSERIDLLGDYVRVIEDAEHGVFGMVVSCPINKSRDYFLSSDVDMTSNETLRELYDPKGKTAYVVNLAIHPKSQGKGEHLRLLADTIQHGAEAGIKTAFFESRLPGFKRWANNSPWFAEKMRVAEKIDVPPPSLEELAKMFPNEVSELADTYWQLTEERNGVEKPKDHLLRKYTDFGCVPLRLIKEAWKPDASSAGYGVLCEYKVSTDVPLEQNSGFMADILAFAKAHKKGLAIGGTALAALGYSISSEGVGDILKTTPWALPAYLGSWALIVSGGVMMLSAAGQEVNLKKLILNPKQELRGVLAKMPENTLAKVGFWINTVGAVAAAGVVIGAAVKALPLAAAVTAAAAPLADLYSTVVIRYASYRWAKNNNNASVE